MTLSDRQNQLIEDLALIDNAQERFAAAIDRKSKQPALAEHDRTEANRVKACLSPVWIAGRFTNGRCYFACHAESPLVKGLIGLLCEIYDGGTPGEIVPLEPTLFEELGLNRTLSPTRRNGLASARSFIRDFAARQHT